MSDEHMKSMSVWCEESWKRAATSRAFHGIQSAEYKGAAAWQAAQGSVRLEAVFTTNEPYMTIYNMDTCTCIKSKIVHELYKPKVDEPRTAQHMLFQSASGDMLEIVNVHAPSGTKPRDLKPTEKVKLNQKLLESPSLQDPSKPIGLVEKFMIGGDMNTGPSILRDLLSQAYKDGRVLEQPTIWPDPLSETYVKGGDYCFTQGVVGEMLLKGRAKNHDKQHDPYGIKWIPGVHCDLSEDTEMYSARLAATNSTQAAARSHHELESVQTDSTRGIRAVADESESLHTTSGGLQAVDAVAQQSPPLSGQDLAATTEPETEPTTEPETVQATTAAADGARQANTDTSIFAPPGCTREQQPQSLSGQDLTAKETQTTESANMQASTTSEGGATEAKTARGTLSHFTDFHSDESICGPPGIFLTSPHVSRSDDSDGMWMPWAESHDEPVLAQNRAEELTVSLLNAMLANVAYRNDEADTIFQMAVTTQTYPQDLKETLQAIAEEFAPVFYNFGAKKKYEAYPEQWQMKEPKCIRDCVRFWWSINKWRAYYIPGIEFLWANDTQYGQICKGMKNYFCHTAPKPTEAEKAAEWYQNANSRFCAWLRARAGSKHIAYAIIRFGMPHVDESWYSDTDEAKPLTSNFRKWLAWDAQQIVEWLYCVAKDIQAQRIKTPTNGSHRASHKQAQNRIGPPTSKLKTSKLKTEPLTSKLKACL
jgi:hypothetical protein